jgi:large subunit ribosomal protein L1
VKKDEAVKALQKMREISAKRNFLQTVEMMINFTGLDMKKPQNQVNVRAIMPYATGKGMGKIAVFAKSQELIDDLKGKVEKIISDGEIAAMEKDKKGVAALMEYDALFAEGPVMLTVAKHLGQQLAPKGKMPKPITTAANFEEMLLKTKSQTTITNKKGKFMPVVHVVVGKETMKDDEMAANMIAAYDAVMNSLPQKKQNIKSIYVKLTMGAPVKMGEF